MYPVTTRNTSPHSHPHPTSRAGSQLEGGHPASNAGLHVHFPIHTGPEHSEDEGERVLEGRGSYELAERRGRERGRSVWKQPLLCPKASLRAKDQVTRSLNLSTSVCWAGLGDLGALLPGATTSQQVPPSWGSAT